MPKPDATFDLNDLPKRGKYDPRVLETVEKVNQKETLEDRLSAAMDELAADLNDVIVNGTKEEQLDAIATFNANREPWIDMVLGKARKQKAR
jgi:hypothetical protein